MVTKKKNTAKERYSCNLQYIFDGGVCHRGCLPQAFNCRPICTSGRFGWAHARSYMRACMTAACRDARSIAYNMRNRPTTVVWTRSISAVQQNKATSSEDTVRTTSIIPNLLRHSGGGWGSNPTPWFARRPCLIIPSNPYRKLGRRHRVWPGAGADAARRDDDVTD